MKLFYITTILTIISIICVAIGLIIKNKKIRNTGFGIMIFIAVFWVVFFIWAIYDAADEYERHFGKENNTYVEDVKSYKEEKGLKDCYYKHFNISFKNGFDLTKNMTYKDKIYHMVIDTYQEYINFKNNDNDVCDMKEADFENNFMIVTAIENTSMVGLTVHDIYNSDDKLIIELNNFIEGEAFEEKHTAISIVIPRTMKKENILVNDMRNREDENPYGWTNTSIKGLEMITENQAIETAKQYAKDLVNSKSVVGKYLKDYTKVYSIELKTAKPNNYWLISEGITARLFKSASFERDVYEVVLVSEHDELEIERAIFYVDAYTNLVIGGFQTSD